MKQLMEKEGVGGRGQEDLIPAVSVLLVKRMQFTPALLTFFRNARREGGVGILKSLEFWERGFLCT